MLIYLRFTTQCILIWMKKAHLIWYLATAWLTPANAWLQCTRTYTNVFFRIYWPSLTNIRPSYTFTWSWSCLVFVHVLHYSSEFTRWVRQADGCLALLTHVVMPIFSFSKSVLTRDSPSWTYLSHKKIT
jgi:hypothetical protein